MSPTPVPPPGAPQSGWRSPAILLMAMAATMQIAFATWWALLNNFAVTEVAFTGREIGIQQSLREIPGFLSFTAVFLLLFMREQRLALLSLVLLGVGVAATGMLPTIWGLYLTTVIMSVGFHYYETMAQSLSLQWLPKADAPRQMGRILAAAAFAQMIAYGFIALAWKTLELSFAVVFGIAGATTVVVALALWFAFPVFREAVPQRKTLVLRKRYWLYYALTFMGGARRQIFTVFAGFMMVEKFGYDVHQVSTLFLVNCVVNMLFAPKIGAFIARVGERRALTVEYVGLIAVFVCYA
ncbi:MAG TPA: MFS transporter, partial [Hyphomicrobiales bacterium]|nr:MFS transporter [Hyphomicrobiales bacterium]